MVTGGSMAGDSHFSRFVRTSRAQGRLVVQPRMGFCRPAQMRAALQQIRASGANCIGTLTIDSHTRLGDHASVSRYLSEARDLNGYPIVHYRPDVTRRVLEGVEGADFPVQVRHGTPDPCDIFERMLAVGLEATEGGPVSYCLPYGRTPLAQSIEAWRRGVTRLAAAAPACHVESFGGCMMGQLTPPSLLIAITLLEGLFFHACGVRSLSLSYAQGPSASQDRAALAVLRGFAADLFPDTDWHVVIYTYMGVFPATEAGAERLIAASARLARDAQCERLIVKTAAERRQIPSVAENLKALRLAEAAFERPAGADPPSEAEMAHRAEIQQETTSLLAAVRDLSADVGEALGEAFRRGILDVPYCLHPDNAGRARGVIDDDGVLRWHEVGGLPLRVGRRRARAPLTSASFLAHLSVVADHYDAPFVPTPEAGPAGHAADATIDAGRGP